MPKLKPLRLVLRGVDKISQPVDRINKRIDRLTKPIRTVTNRLDKLGRAVGLRKLRSAITRTGKSFGVLASRVGGLASRLFLIGGAAGTAAFLALNKVADEADKIAKTSEKLGLSSRFLQQIGFAGKRAGLDTNVLNIGLQRFTRRMAEAANGTGEARGALKFLLGDLGNLRDESGKIRAMPDVLREVADAILKIEDPAMRVRVAFKLFDSEGVALVNLLQKGSVEMDRLFQRADALGLVMSEDALDGAVKYRDALVDLKAVATGFAFQIAGRLAPVITDLVDRFIEWRIANRELIDARLTAGVENLVSGTVKLFGAIERGVPKVLAWVESMGGIVRVAKIVAAVLGASLLAPIVVALVAVFAALGAVVGLLATPVGLAIAAFALFAGAAVLIRKQWSGISSFFDSLLGGIADKIGQVVGLGEKLVGLPGRLGRGIRNVAVAAFGSSDAATQTAPRSSPAITSSPAVAAAGGADSRARVEIAISQDRPPEVRRVVTSSPSVDLSVETGLTLIPAGT